jgi:hypothetical protein
MGSTDQRILDSLRVLHSDVVTPKRFEQWKQDHQHLSNTLDDCVTGEIFWRKAMGRPNKPNLSDGVQLSSWTNQQQQMTCGGENVLRWISTPHLLNWQDGNDDGEYWRVIYLISGVWTSGNNTFIVPELVKNVPWTVPSNAHGIGNAGIRVYEPRYVEFIKKMSGIVYYSFEIVPTLFVHETYVPMSGDFPGQGPCN